MHDHRVVAHRPTDESSLTRKRRRRSFSNDDDVLAVVRFTPREVVVVVHEIDLARAENRHDFARHPLASRVGVLSGKIHQVPVVVARRFGDVEQHLALGHALAPRLSLTDREKGRGDGMTEAARAEVDADPERARLVGEHVDVMVSASDGAKLLARLVSSACRCFGGTAVHDASSNNG